MFLLKKLQDQVSNKYKETEFKIFLYPRINQLGREDK